MSWNTRRYLQGWADAEAIHHREGLEPVRRFHDALMGTSAVDEYEVGVRSFLEQKSGTVKPMETPLLATDRCDRCGVQAYVRATLPSDLELLFCAHHWGEHQDRVRPLAVSVHDETKMLVAPKG